MGSGVPVQLISVQDMGYTTYLPEHCIESDKVYRSVHYIIKYQGVYLEIQVRTLFEEGWGEVDHSIVYPNHVNDPIFRKYTALINRVSGIADEMSSFFHEVEKLETFYTQNNKVDTEEVSTPILTQSPSGDVNKHEGKNENGQEKTAKGCVDEVVQE